MFIQSLRQREYVREAPAAILTSRQGLQGIDTLPLVMQSYDRGLHVS